jgi:hypothetical protein
VDAEREDLGRAAADDTAPHDPVPADPVPADPVTADPVPADPAVEAPAGEALLRALLQIPQRDAAIIRDATPARIRPSRQSGPTADYGAAE